MDDELSKIIKLIGSVVLAAFMYALPILLTCSFAFHWDPIVKLLLAMMNTVLFIAVCSTIYVEVED